MESGLPNKRRTFRTNDNVLRTHQLSSHFPNHDEHYIRPRNSRTMANHLHGRHGHTYPKIRKRNRTTAPRTPPRIRPTHPRKTTGTQPFPQTGKVYLQTTPNRIPRCNGRSRHSTDEHTSELQSP